MDKELVEYFISETNKKYEKLEARLIEMEKTHNRVIGMAMTLSFLVSIIFHVAFLYTSHGR